MVVVDVVVVVVVEVGVHISTGTHSTNDAGLALQRTLCGPCHAHVITL